MQRRIRLLLALAVSNVLALLVYGSLLMLDGPEPWVDVPLPVSAPATDPTPAPKNASVTQPPTPRRKEHTFFTTYHPKPDYVGAYRKSLDSMLKVADNILVLNDTQKNRYGYPYLKELYRTAQRWYHASDTYTYYNADLLFNNSALRATLDALVEAAEQGRISKRFLGVGFRHNVRWNLSDDFDKMYRHSTQFVGDAQDYFVASRSLWDWSKIPCLVVGRRAYDNWLVQHAVHMRGVDVIDLSKTVTALHLTVHGNRDGHQGEETDDVDFNTRVLQKADPRWDMGAGQMGACHKETVWRDGRVVVVSRYRFYRSRSQRGYPDIKSQVCQ